MNKEKLINELAQIHNLLMNIQVSGQGMYALVSADQRLQVVINDIKKEEENFKESVE